MPSNSQIQNAPCHICGAKGLSIIEKYSELFRVTSDCRPWKRGGNLSVCPTCGTVQKVFCEDYDKECAEIYMQYAVYHQAGGAEQRVFDLDGGGSFSRSDFLLQRVLEKVAVLETGRMLDIGCGNGSMLKAFSKAMPGWRLSGCELDDRSKEQVLGISKVEFFYSGQAQKINDVFDIVSMIHTLEHIPNPGAFLAGIRHLLAPNGLLLIELPDFTQNPFDLVIADHCTHFEQQGLGWLARFAGFEVLFSGELVPKETTLMAQKLSGVDSGAHQNVNRPNAVEQVTWALDWLAGARDLAVSLSQEGDLGIFGTSIAGTWLFGELSGNVNFFVDEDPNRVGTMFMERPVLHPKMVRAGQRVFVPLAPTVARAVCERFKNLSGVFISPPFSSPSQA